MESRSGPVLLARPRERLLAPRVPVHRVVLVLEEVGRRLLGEAVGHSPTLPVVEQLEVLVGEWRLEADFPGVDPGRATFEWLPGKRFLALRWEVPMPEAPDGLAVMGWDEGRGTLLQHYFDSRGVCRVYTMSFDGRTWTMSRTQADFSPLPFSQRWTADGQPRT